MYGFYENTNRSVGTMIPKIIHQIWIGKKPISEEHRGYVERWKKMYPSFTHVLWDNIMVEKESIIPAEKQCYYSSPEYPIALKADILRYEIIRKFGGIYSDVDNEPLKPISDSVLDNIFFGGIQPNEEVAIGIFGAAPGCRLLADVCNSVDNHIQKKLEQGCSINSVDQLTGPIFFNRMCQPYLKKDGYVFLPPKYFYPYWFTEMNRKGEDFYSTSPDAYSVHHWARNWI